jgi:hypothetical protein
MAVVLPNWSKLSPEDIALLSKILGAIKLSLAAVKVVDAPVIKLHELPHAQTADTLLIFGTKTEPIIELYKKEKIKNFHVIAADALNQLDDVKKKNLWLALKQL